MILEQDFKFRDDIKADTVPIELLTDPYKGVVLRYTNVGVKELENNTAVLQFGYELYEMGDHTETKLRRDKRFQEHAGLVLNALILESADIEEKESE